MTQFFAHRLIFLHRFYQVSFMSLATNYVRNKILKVFDTLSSLNLKKKIQIFYTPPHLAFYTLSLWFFFNFMLLGLNWLFLPPLSPSIICGHSWGNVTVCRRYMPPCFTVSIFWYINTYAAEEFTSSELDTSLYWLSLNQYHCGLFWSLQKAV